MQQQRPHHPSPKAAHTFNSNPRPPKSGPLPPQQDIPPLAAQFLGTPHQGPASKPATRERQLIASCKLSFITDSTAFSMQMWLTDQQG